MDLETLKKLYRINLYTVRANTEGVTQEESLRTPEPGGSSLNWVLGHVVSARDVVLGHLGQEPVLTEGERAPYARGGSPDSEHALDLALLKRRLVASQRRLEEGLDAAEEKALAAPIDDGEGYPPGIETQGDRLAFFQFHEAYHCGQIAVLRRLAGREGAIR